MYKAKIWAGLLAIFVFGCICGAAGTGLYARHRVRQIIQGGPAAVREAIVSKLRYDLSLDREQRERVREVVAQAQKRVVEGRRKTQPQIETILDGAVTEMKDVLRPEQIKKLEELRANLEKAWKLNAPAGETGLRQEVRP
jgi:hypothetical protein